MKYYSKSPKEFYEERNRESAKLKRVFTRGRIILLFDIALVVLVMFFYQSAVKDSGVKSERIKSFQLGQASVTAYCEIKAGRCVLEMNDAKGETPADQCHWSVKDKGGALILEETMLLAKNVEERRTIYRSEFQIPEELKEEGDNIRVMLRLTNQTGKDLIAFTIYP